MIILGVESMLLGAPNQLLLLLALVGPFDGIGAVEYNWKSTESFGRIYTSNTTGLEGLAVLSAYAVDAAVALLISTVDSDRSVGLEWTIRLLYRIGSLL